MFYKTNSFSIILAASEIKTKALPPQILSQNLPEIKAGVSNCNDDKKSLIVTLKFARKRAITPPRNTRVLRKKKIISYVEKSDGKSSESLPHPRVSKTAKSAAVNLKDTEKTSLMEPTPDATIKEILFDDISLLNNSAKMSKKNIQKSGTKPATMKNDILSCESTKLDVDVKPEEDIISKINQNGSSKSKVKAKVEKVVESEPAAAVSVRRRSSKSNPSSRKINSHLIAEPFPRLTRSQTSKLALTANNDSTKPASVSANAKALPIDETGFRLVNKATGKASSVTNTLPITALLNEHNIEPVSTKDESLTADITTIDETVAKFQISNKQINERKFSEVNEQLKMSETESVITITKGTEVEKSDSSENSSCNFKPNTLESNDNGIKVQNSDAESCSLTTKFVDNKNILVSSLNSDSIAAIHVKTISPDSSLDLSGVDTLKHKPDTSKLHKSDMTLVTSQEAEAISIDLNEVTHDITNHDLLDTSSKSKNIFTSKIQQDSNGLEYGQPNSYANETQSTFSAENSNIDPKIGAMSETKLQVIDSLSVTDDMTYDKTINFNSNLSLLSEVDAPSQLTKLVDSDNKSNLFVFESRLPVLKDVGLKSSSIISEAEVNLKPAKSDRSVTQMEMKLEESQFNILGKKIQSTPETVSVPSVSVKPMVSKNPDSKVGSILEKSESSIVKVPQRISVREAMLKALPASAINRKQSFRSVFRNKNQSDNKALKTSPSINLTVAAPVPIFMVTHTTDTDKPSSSLSAGSSSENFGEVVKLEFPAPSSETITTTDKSIIDEKVNTSEKIESIIVSSISIEPFHSTDVKDLTNFQLAPSVPLFPANSSNQKTQNETLETPANPDDTTHSKVSETSLVATTKRTPKATRKTSSAKRKISIKNPPSLNSLPITGMEDDVQELVQDHNPTATVDLSVQNITSTEVSFEAQVSAQTVSAEKSPRRKIVKKLPGRPVFETLNNRNTFAKYGTTPKKNSRAAQKLDEIDVLRTLRDSTKPEALPLPVVFTPSSDITQNTKELLKTETVEDIFKSADKSLANQSSRPDALVKIGIASLSISKTEKATEPSFDENSKINVEKNDFDLKNHKTTSQDHRYESDVVISDVSASSDVSDRVPVNSFKNHNSSSFSENIKTTVLNLSESSNPASDVPLKLNRGFRVSRRPTALEQLELIESLKKTKQFSNSLPLLDSEVSLTESFPGGPNYDEIRTQVESFIIRTNKELNLVPDMMQSRKKLEKATNSKIVDLKSTATSDKSTVVLNDNTDSAVPFNVSGIISALNQTAETKDGTISSLTLRENVVDETMLDQSPSLIHENTKLSGKKKDVNVKESSEVNKKGGLFVSRRPPSSRVQKLRSDKVMQSQYQTLFATPFQFIFDDNKRHDITADDFIKLNEGEYLNDTLINFYLKYYHQLTMKANEDLAKLVYIFNTFFYEKLARRDTNGNVGYDFVRTWTTKIDLFKMKYVIVPINTKMHWYLAIIYNLPALLKEKKTENDNEKTAESKAGLKKSPVIFDDNPNNSTTSQSPPGEQDGEPNAAESTVFQLKDAEIEADVPAISNFSESKASSDEPVFTRVTRKGTRVYTKRSAKESTPKVARTRKISVEDNCVIFILDSFKSRNYTVLSRNLKDYICKEASDKLNITIDKQRIVTKQVDVPQQNNFCDCGVYLIHYVERFLMEPTKIVELMAKVMKTMDSKNQVVINELLRMWDMSMIAKKRGILKSEIIMCKNKQDQQQDTKKESNQQNPEELQKQIEKKDTKEQQQKQQKQKKSLILKSQLYEDATLGKSDNESSKIKLNSDVSETRVDSDGNSTARKEEVVGDDEDDVVVVDVMQKIRRGPKRGKQEKQKKQ